MKKIVLIFITLLCCSLSSAQKEASNWYFGENAGISFDTDANTVTPVFNGALSTIEGCTSISGTNGGLLFYTDGITVFNSLHTQMVNGNGLFGNPSSTQSAIIIPKPDTPNIYYIFTVDTDDVGAQNSAGFRYSIVDMSLDGGLGAVTNIKNEPLLGYTSEKVSAVLEDCDSGNIWVIAFAHSSGQRNSSGFNTFFRYKISNSNVNNGVEVFPPVTFNNTITDRRGYLKFSPDGSKLASASLDNGLYLYDFESSTGDITNPLKINISGSNNQPYGVEFSPNSNILYVTTSNDLFGDGDNIPSNHSSVLHQYNLLAANIAASGIVINSRNLYRSALQLGPDGKIYRSMAATYTQGLPTLSVIENPNQLGPACNYVENAISLGNNSTQGLPPFITSFFSENIDIIQNGTSTTNLDLCLGETYTLQTEDISGATYTWTQDGVLLAESDFDLEVNNTNGPGLYEVVTTLNNGNCGTITGSANVTFSQIPVANTPNNLTTCSDVPDTNIGTFNFEIQTPTVLGAQSSTQFNVSYFSSAANANNNTNAITGDYQNSSNPQTIFVRIENVDNPNCFNLTSFETLIYITPEVYTTSNLEVCDNDTNATNGQTMVTLSNFDAEVLGNQNINFYTISYYANQADADAGTNSHPDNYTNNTPFTEPLYIRIENNNDSTCYSTANISLIVNPSPETINVDLYQCDEDGVVDGLTVFNLTQANDSLSGNNPDLITQFYNSQVDADNNINALNSTSYNSISNPETLHVRVTNTITGCYNTSSTLTLETSDTQIYNYYAPAVCDELGSEDGKNSFNLDDFSINILGGLPANNLTISYFETINNALLETNALSSPYQNTTPYAQTLYVRVENDNACYGINEVYLTINPRPQLEVDQTLLYCLNEFPTTLTLDAGLMDTPGNYSFNWSNSENTETIQVNTIGTYTVTVTNNTTSCNKTRTFTVEPSNIATIEAIEIVDGGLNNNQIVVLTSGEGEYQYALTDQEGNTTAFQDSNVFTQLAPGIYSIAIRDIKYNCGIVTQEISVIGFPLYFTPNGDNINDTWQVYGVSSQFQPNSQILIFDRYGKLITQIKPSSSGWDGTLNGTPLPQSDYWFSATLQDGRVYKNHFTLKR